MLFAVPFKSPPKVIRRGLPQGALPVCKEALGQEDPNGKLCLFVIFLELGILFVIIILPAVFPA